ncbi:MAG: hypothetical protein J6A58_13530 [Oscillospiraceae bacterium]|nr:hypothetical protein [Oscillospiraceae bacterium]
MCKAIYDIREDAKLEGTHDANIEVAKKLLILEKLSFEEISSICSLSLEEINKLAKETLNQ